MSGSKKFYREDAKDAKDSSYNFQHSKHVSGALRSQSLRLRVLRVLAVKLTWSSPRE